MTIELLGPVDWTEWRKQSCWRSDGPQHLTSRPARRPPVPMTLRGRRLATAPNRRLCHKKTHHNKEHLEIHANDASQQAANYHKGRTFQSLI